MVQYTAESIIETQPCIPPWRGGATLGWPSIARALEHAQQPLPGAEHTSLLLSKKVYAHGRYAPAAKNRETELVASRLSSGCAGGFPRNRLQNSATSQGSKPDGRDWTRQQAAKADRFAGFVAPTIFARIYATKCLLYLCE